MNTSLRIAAALAVILFTTLGAQARTHHGYHHASYRGRGSCDGFDRCRCGTTAARHFGLPYDYQGNNLKRAWTWAQVFPHTSFHVGAAGVVHHHVLAITGGSDCAHAMVHDDAGDYQRNVCGMTFVEVSGGGYTQQASAHPRQHRHRGYAQYASASETQPDRLSIH